MSTSDTNRKIKELELAVTVWEPLEWSNKLNTCKKKLSKTHGSWLFDSTGHLVDIVYGANSLKMLQKEILSARL